ncbi:MAG: hypothetical protein NVSMB51_14220 [Solirubrobacteraceae bacterium]
MATRATILAAALSLSLAAGCGSQSKHAAAPPVNLAPAAPDLVKSGQHLVAHVNGKRIAVYRSPDATRPARYLSNPNGLGFPRVLLVKAAQPDWLQVYLPERPNGSTGWVKSSAVSIKVDPYRVRVDLTKHKLLAWRGGTLIERVPIGVGQAVTPTPAGLYYVTELIRLTDPTGPYGPYGFGTSAYSTVLHQFAGGNGQIGIHGTNDPAGIGTNVSHGCIRLANKAILKLAHLLPLGTPVRIVR